MSLLDRIVFVLRQSPDWSALARDTDAGIRVDASRYTPRGDIEGFPKNITECIQAWDAIFPLSFFRCREQLKSIAFDQLRSTEASVILAEHEAGQLAEIVGEDDFLLFFLDDDDWFSPDTFGKVSGLELGGADFAVFPLVRFELDTFTFVPRNESARALVGNRRNFTHRFQTNNYALSRRTALSADLMKLKDHCEASYFATESGMRDVYFDSMISATNKTPCSASLLPEIVRDPREYQRRVRSYVDNLGALEIPDELSWCRDPLDRTVRLFQSLL